MLHCCGPKRLLKNAINVSLSFPAVMKFHDVKFVNIHQVQSGLRSFSTDEKLHNSRNNNSTCPFTRGFKIPIEKIERTFVFSVKNFVNFSVAYRLSVLVLQICSLLAFSAYNSRFA